MALPIIDRALDAFGDIFNGAAFSLDLEQPPHRTEEAAVGLYDVGQVVRQYSREWLGVTPNLVSPANLLSLLLTLDELTAQLEAHVANLAPTSTTGRLAALGVMGAAVPGLGPGLWMLQDQSRRDNARALEAVVLDLERWRVRLDAYLRHVEAVADPTDRRLTLWEVTAPLFLGWFGGETGSEVELPTGGFPPGFDPEARHVADLSTPFQIANELGVWLEWDHRMGRLLAQDVEDGVKDVVDAATDLAGGVAGAVPTRTSPLPYLLAGAVAGGVGLLVLRSKMK